jgi:hypothetical protein
VIRNKNEGGDVNIAGTIGRIAAVLATVSALAVLAGVAQAETSTALMLRSEALNQEYGLGPQRAVPQGMTAAEYRALMLRSEALSPTYGLDEQKAAAVTSRPTSSTGGFAWGAFGIGAAVMLGLALLAGRFFVLHRLATLRGLTLHRTS